MAIIYKLVGYDRESEALVLEYELPPRHVGHAKQIAGIAGKPEIVGDWSLSPGQARQIGELVAAHPDLVRCDWFLEPYEVSAPAGK